MVIGSKVLPGYENGNSNTNSNGDGATEKLRLQNNSGGSNSNNGDDDFELKDSLGERFRENLKHNAGYFAGQASKKANSLANQFADTKVGAATIAGGKKLAGTKYGKKTIKGVKKLAGGAKNIATSRVTKAAGKVAIKGVKRGAKAVWKNKRAIARGVAGAGMGVIGAGIGFGAALATGDVSNVAKFTAAGAMSGNMLGRKSVNLAADIGTGAKNAVSSGGSRIKSDWQDAYYGIAEADEKRRKSEYQKNYRRFMKDEEQQKQAKMVQAQLAKQGHEANLKDIMKSRYDYVAAGIKNEDIERAQLAEGKMGINGSTHAEYVSVASEANRQGITASTFSDKKKYNEFTDTFAEALGGEQKANNAMEKLAEIKGVSFAHQRALKERRAEQAKAAAEAKATANATAKPANPNNAGKKVDKT